MTLKECPQCSSKIEESDKFCQNCGFVLKDEKISIFDNLDSNFSISSILISFIVIGLCLFLFSTIFSFLLSKGIIDYSTFLGLSLIFSTFIGGLILGYICGSWDKSKSNLIIIILLIASIFLIVGGLGYGSGIGMSSLLTGTSDTASINDFDTSSNINNAVSTAFAKIIIFLVLSILLFIGGCYIGSYLKINEVKN